MKERNRFIIVLVPIIFMIYMGVGFLFDISDKDFNKPYEEIETPLDEKGIVDGVVIDDQKDKKDISEKTFEANKKKEKKEKKDHYYTLGDIGKATNRLKPVKIIRPPKGMNVDNISQVPDPQNTNKNNMPFKDYVVFYPQHQDDEVLWAGSAIREAINARGRDHVFIVLVSSGTGHKIFKKPEFKNMSLKEKAEFRNREFLESCKALGIPRDNIYFIYKQRGDWKTDFKLERDFALKMEKKYKSVTHITHSYKYDDHFMHRANGQTLYELWKKGQISDLRFYIKPFLLEYVDATKNVLNVYSVNKIEDYNRIKEACMAYKYINAKKMRNGIGYKTDFLSFDALVYDQGEKSYIIIQNNKTEG